MLALRLLTGVALVATSEVIAFDFATATVDYSDRAGHERLAATVHYAPDETWVAVPFELVGCLTFSINLLFWLPWVMPGHGYGLAELSPPDACPPWEEEAPARVWLLQWNSPQRVFLVSLAIGDLGFVFYVFYVLMQALQILALPTPGPTARRLISGLMLMGFMQYSTPFSTVTSHNASHAIFVAAISVCLGMHWFGMSVTGYLQSIHLGGLAHCLLPILGATLFLVNALRCWQFLEDALMPAHSPAFSAYLELERQLVLAIDPLAYCTCRNDVHYPTYSTARRRECLLMVVEVLWMLFSCVLPAVASTALLLRPTKLKCLLVQRRSGGSAATAAAPALL